MGRGLPEPDPFVQLPQRTWRQDGWDEHARFIGGPLAGEREILHAISAPSEQAVRQRLAQDNWHQNGMLTIESIEPRTVLLDGRRV